MRYPDLPSHLNPLYASLRRIGIPAFLLTSYFKDLMIENDWNQTWDICLEEARYELRNVDILAPDYTGYVKIALGIFIDAIAVGLDDAETLFFFIEKLLKTYLKSGTNSCDLNCLHSPLVTAGYQKEDVDCLLTELQAIKDSIPDKQNKIQGFDGLNSISLGTHSADTSQALEQVIRLCSRFHVVAKQLRSRYGDRPALDINDEYDVQYLFRGLLSIFFDDVRPEEYTPSSAGKATRMDFLLKEEEIGVELKMTREGLSDKELANQLILDIKRYPSHGSCKTLVFFVYDPEGRIANPRGLQADLNSDKQGPKVIVVIEPKP